MTLGEAECHRSKFGSLDGGQDAFSGRAPKMVDLEATAGRLGTYSSVPLYASKMAMPLPMHG